MIQVIFRSFPCGRLAYFPAQVRTRLSATPSAVGPSLRLGRLQHRSFNSSMECLNWDFNKFPAVKPSLRQKFEELLLPANNKDVQLSASSSSSPTPIEDRIHSKLELLKPTHLYIRNDSHKHRHHKAMQGRLQEQQVPESHFYVEITSHVFDTSPPSTMLERHRALYWLLAKELSEDVSNGGGAVHALQLVTRTPDEADKIMKR